MPDSPPKLRFLHLSDIHFTSRDSETSRKNAHLRDQLVTAAKRECDESGALTGILVGGDIAYHGTPAEFDAAETWLARLCEATGCDNSNVWVIPGNHDVAWDEVESSELLKNLHRGIREDNQQSTDPGKRLMNVLLDPKGGGVLLSPLDHYNDFAAYYGCAITTSLLHWEEDFELDDGSTLLVRGLCSATMSTKQDHLDSCRLVLPESECLVPTIPGVAYLFLCHHPPEWMCGTSEIAKALNAQGQVQLFGHKHSFALNQVNQSVIVSAGAVHPDPGERDWSPRFNVLTLWVEGMDGNRTLRVGVAPWVWYPDSQSFQQDLTAKSAHPDGFYLQLAPWTRPVTAALEPAAEDLDPAKAPNATIITSLTSKDGSMNAARRLVHRFMSLNYLTRLEIARQLNLIEDTDEGRPTRDLYKLYFRRAEQSGALAKLWDAVENAHPDPHVENPFTHLD